jgi:two-component system chemotaxis response regulator CheB
LLRRVLEADGDIEVVGEATDAEGAVELVRASRPDVVTLDLQISGGGLETIGSLLRVRPTPILVLSVAVEGVWSTRAVDALAAGAADVLPKPVRWDDKAKATVRDRVRAIAGVRLHPGAVVPPPRAAAPGPDANPDRVVAMAASTGGPPALAHVLSGLAGIPAPVLVVQHLHSDFMAGFVAWLDRLSPIPVKAARQGERLKAGTVYVAPGEQHLRLGARRIAMLDAQPERIHRPSADELFASVASVAGADAVGVLLTGMGADGAVGLAEIRKAGGLAVVQDEATSAVFGMPQAAIKAGAADKVLPLDRIAEAVMAAVTRPRRARGARRAR